MLGKRKILFGFMFSLFVVSMLGGFASVQATTNYTPQIFVYSDLTKDVVDLNNVFRYVDNSGNNATLQYYQVQSGKNITFHVTGIEFSRQFENASLDGTITCSGSNSYDVDLLKDTNGISYLMLKIWNTSAISTSSWYYLQLDNTVEKTLPDPENTWILFIGKVQNISASASYYLQVAYTIKDEFSNQYTIILKFHYNDRGYTGDTIYVYVERDYNIIQVNMKALLDSVGLSIRPSKLVKVSYKVAYYEADTLEQQYTFAGMIYAAAVIDDKPLKINDVLLNATAEVTIPATDKIRSTIPVNKIADVQIPAVLNLQVYDPNIDGDKEPFWDLDKAGDYKIKYTWKFSLPDDPAIQFSNTQVNLTLPDFDGFSISNITEFIVDTQDELSGLSSYKAGDEITVISNPSTGDLHLIIMTISYPVEIYNAIMGEGAGWFYFLTNPLGALYFGIGVVISVIAGYLGVKSLKKKGEEYKAKGLPKSKKGLKTL
ncbi:MAG: hypothetical protein J7L47_09145 [Candidatus Odinarchaeota archaeon]|nr:hypothetical protein [Candidatus Odinarchaeota archaeon]